MKKLLKIVVVLVAVLLVAAAAGAAYLYSAYPKVPAAETVTVQATPEKLARGKYLVENVTACVDCHSLRDMTR